MTNSVDITIIGGGLVGLTAAIALAGGGMKVAVIETRPLETIHTATSDGRASALAYGSYLFLKETGLWEKLARQAGPILDIRVSDGDSRLFLHYDHRLVGDAPMGFMVENHAMLKALVEQVEAHENIILYSPATWEHITYHPHAVDITLQDGRHISSQLLIAADGKHSLVRKQAGISTRTHDYAQWGIVCTVEHEAPHHGIAQERFLPAGPFAILPLKNPHRSSLVWTEKSHLAPLYLAMEDEAFNAQIHKRFGGYLGEVRTISQRFSYPLSFSLAKAYTAPRLVLIGDAAHGIHPLAGQGFNLGIRDCETIAPLLIQQHHLGLDVGDRQVLAGYERLRHFDTLSLLAITHGLNALFGTSLPPVKLARRLGMAFLNRLPAAKKFFMMHAMGLSS